MEETAVWSISSKTLGPSTCMSVCQCHNCGGITVYADDSTYTVSNKDQEQLSEILSEKFSVMADYLTANRLKVNGEKTHLNIMTTEQKRRNLFTA